MATYTNTTTVYSGGEIITVDSASDIVQEGGFNNTPIGASTASTGAFTTLDAATSAVAATLKVTDLSADQVVYSSAADGELSSSAALTFDGTDLACTGTVTGASSSVFGTLTLADGSITDSTGAIDFGNENLTTTGDIAGKNGAFTGDLVVQGDIVSRGATDVLIADLFLDLGAGNTTTAAAAGGLTFGMNRNAAFTASTVTTMVAGVAATSNPTFTATDATSSSVLAANDVVAITGMGVTGNDGLYLVTAVDQASFPQIVTIAGIGLVAVDGALPFCQNQFTAETGATGSAFKVDLAVWCVADGSASFTDAAAATYAKGTFITAYAANATKGQFTTDGDYKTATSTLQAAYDGGATITTAGATDIAYTLSGGDFTATGTGAVTLTPTAASSFTSGGALTLTAGGASTWSTSAGALTLTSAAAATWSTALGVLALDGAGGVTVTSTGGTLTLDGAGQTVDLNAAGLDIDCTAASNITATSAALTVETVTSGTLTVGSAGVLALAGADNSTIAVTGATKTLDIDATGIVSVNSSGAAINIGDDAIAQPVNIATGNAARDITIGNVASGSMTLEAGVGALTADCDGVLSLNSSGGVIEIGNDNVGQNMFVGTGGARTIAIGSATATAVTVDAIAMSLDSTDVTNLTMTTNDAGAKLLTIRAINSNAGGSGDMLVRADDLMTLKADLISMEQVLGHVASGAVNIGTVLVLTSATEVAHGSATGINMKRVYGIAKAAATNGNPVLAVTHHGTVVDMAASVGVTAGDPLFLTGAAGEVSNVPPSSSGDTVYCIGFACETIGVAGQVAAMYAPQRLAQIG